MSEPLLQRREGAVLVLSNNNPAARNALSPAFYAALTQALAAAQVAARAKMPALARQHDGAHAGVGLGLGQRLGERRVKLGRQRIAGRRVVVGEHQHGAFAAGQQDFAHLRSPVLCL